MLTTLYKYLGVLIGNGFDIYDIFDEAVKKITNRVNSYMHLKKSFSVPKRILIANVFIIPILSYLGQFFALPWYHRMEIERQLSRWVIPGFNPFSLQASCRPSNWINLRQPLRDITGDNMAALAMTYVKSNQLSWPHAEVDLNSIGDIVVKSPRINAHAQGAIKFLEAYGITISDCKSRRQIYSSFVSSDQKINSLIDDLNGKLLRWKADGNACT